jgi:transcriptional regulator with XRE-family HTH domain
MVRKASITADEVRAIRERMGLTLAQLAGEMGIDADDLRKWEDGSVKPPRGTGQNLAYTVALLERRAALAASGLPECAWVTAWEQEPEAENLDRVTEQLERLNEHSAACPACLARERYVDQRFPPLPELYTPPFMRPLDVVMTAIDRLPRWLRPAALGAAAVFAMTAMRFVAVGIAAAFGGRFPGFGGMIPVLLLAMAAGASGGLVYSAVHPTFRRLGRPGDYLTGIACVVAYVVSFATVAPIAFGETLAETTDDWVAMLVIAAFFGLVVGHTWFGPGRGVPTHEARRNA